MDLQKLRRLYPVFSYQSYNWEVQNNDLIISWKMGNDEYQFHPQLAILGASSKVKNLPKETIDNFIFHLGMVEIFSYWKAFCSPVIEVKAGFLDKYQLTWWKDLLLKGMGQYFYENSIDFMEKDFVTLYCLETQPSSSPFGHLEDGAKRLIPGEGTLIAVSGGKDSAVTLELLSNNFALDSLCILTLNPPRHKNIGNMIKISGIENVIRAERSIDSELLELNKKGYPNGHTPFSAYLAFLSIFTAELFGCKETVFSNEKSSDEGNLEFLGIEINHQYSKTFKFENKFREYNKRYLSNINYFSFLRPLYELQIMKIFGNMRKYFSDFLSCNNQTTIWCGKCPKCLASFIGLYPFVEIDMLETVFGRNLFNDENLISVALEMLGLGNKKPFECVGTVEETKIAFYLSLKKTAGLEKMPLLKYFSENVMTKETNWQTRTENILKSWDKNHNLPKKYENILKSLKVLSV